MQRTRASRSGVLALALAVLTMSTGGCVLSPQGMAEEREKAKLDGEANSYSITFDKRALPVLPARPGWKEVLERGLLASGELEAAFHEWRGALQRVDMASAWPNSNIELSFEYMFSGERMKSWDRTTIAAGFDPSMGLTAPNKVAQAGKVALAEAQAAGLRFQQMKFDVQKELLDAWTEFAGMAERVRIEDENVALLRLVTEIASAGVQAGRLGQQDLIRAQLQQRLAENELASMRSQLVSMRAMLNGMLALDPNAPLEAPERLPPPRGIPIDDARIIAVAVDKNQELAALAAQVRGRRDALELARLQWFPDINPMAGFTGSIEQFIGAGMMLPTAIPMIRASIEEARAMLAAQEAMLRQGRQTRGAEVLAVMVLARSSDRQAQLLESTVLPQARQVVDTLRESYAAGSSSFTDLIDGQRTLLDVRRMVVTSRVAREKAVAELECLICVDLETLDELMPTTAPTTLPTTAPAEISQVMGRFDERANQ